MTTVLIAPDSFKGSLTSVQVARALAAGWSRIRPDDEILLCPLADGGEGTLAAIEAAGGWTWQRADVRDPIGRRIPARWLRSTDGRRAVIEMAEASGLSRLTAGERDPIGATSVGTGELMGTAIDAGVTHITLGIGGSATSDGGRGLLEGLGTSRRLDAIDLEVACDVTNPLLGPTGAAATYGPQKGATPDDVATLDARNLAWADELEARVGRHERDTAGAGAAGGVGFALLAMQSSFGSFALRTGVELLMESTGFDDKLARANIVLTGEGRIDGQTAFGKTAMGVSRRAHAAGLPSIAFGGGVTPEGIVALEPFGTVVVPVIERPGPLEEAMASGEEPVVRAGARVAALFELGATR